MKKKKQFVPGLIKGTSSSVLLSAVIHGVLLLLAASFVAVKIIKQDPAVFEPVEVVDRPKMPPPKIVVKPKTTAKPKKNPDRITTSRVSDSMPKISLPQVTGMGEGLGGVGGFQMVADVGNMSLMGSGQSVGNDFEGTYYYLMQTRSGSKYTGMSGEEGANTPGTGLFSRFLKEFLENDWDESVFDEFYRAPQKLYTTQFFIPLVSSSLAPEKFGDTSNNEAAYWLAHYKGEISHPTGGRFRFWGYADDILFVRINGEIVLDAGYSIHYEADLGDWRSSDPDNRKFTISKAKWRIGDWFEVKPGERVDMEVILGEIPGGGFMAALCVEEEGVEYPEREIGGPLLPIFKTMETPEHIIDEMAYTLPDGQVDFYGGPVFSAY